MTHKREPARQAVPPTITPHRAIELLRRQLDRLDEIIELGYDDPRVGAWENSTENILAQAYGRPNGEHHPNFTEFAQMPSGFPLYIGMNAYEIQQHHIARQARRRELLRAIIEQLQDLAPPAAATAEHYVFHPEVERVSGHLLRDGHYKQAAYEAYILVIEAVKQKSGLQWDGDDLMNRAFGCDNRVPVLQVNSLSTRAEQDEQRGFMYLFKGIVGLRNSKAHSNTLFNDPSRAHEYLALASLLIRILELARVNRVA